MKRWLLVCPVLFLFPFGCEYDGTLGLGGDSVATASLSYQLVSSGEIEDDLLSVESPRQVTIRPDDVYYSQQTVRETAALANFMLGLDAATDAYFADLITFCEDLAENLEITCPDGVEEYYGMTCEEYLKQEREYQRLVCLGNEEIPPNIDEGVAGMGRVIQFLQAENHVLSGALDREIDLAKAISDNMAAGGAAAPYRDWGMGGGYGGTAPQADASMGGGGLGATPGGAQDIGYIRTVVDEGYIPLPFHLAVEGLFSEHDLPLEGTAPCDQLLCVRAGLGVAPALDSGEMNYFVQIGFSSGLRADTFQRTPLNLAVVLDKSGSMSDFGGEGGSKMEATKAALIKMVDKLTPNDRLSLVLFNSAAEVILDNTPVTDPAAIKALISGIEPGGGTNIEAGLRLGFELVEAYSQPSQRMDRVMLLTDALPNVGRTGEGDFLTMAQHYADLGIGLTTFGVGFNFGQELILALSQIRGGNYFFLEDAERIAEVFELDFDYLVTPLAYDLQLGFQPAEGFETLDVHGIPSWTPGDDLVEMQVATLFLSRNHGAILIRLAR